MKTIVLHPTDSTTTFLSLSYEGLDCDVINDFSKVNKEELKEKLKEYDRIIMMGHGCGSGLFNPQGGGILIDDSFADILRERESISIWCFSDVYFKRNHISGFHTGVIISEVSEERWKLRNEPLNEREMYDNMVMFSKALRKAFDETSPERMAEVVLENYVGDDPVTQFNRGNIKNIGEADFTHKYTYTYPDDTKKLDWKPTWQPTYIWDDEDDKDSDGYDYTYGDYLEDEYGDIYFDGKDGLHKYTSDEFWDMHNVDMEKGMVTKIEPFQFEDQKELTGLELPDTVVHIGEYAFTDCHNLKELKLGDGVKYIGDGAFSFCDALERLNIPGTTKSIGKGILWDVPCDVMYDGTKNMWNAIVKDEHWGDGFRNKIVCKDGIVEVSVRPEVEDNEENNSEINENFPSEHNKILHIFRHLFGYKEKDEDKDPSKFDISSISNVKIPEDLINKIDDAVKNHDLATLKTLYHDNKELQQLGNDYETQANRASWIKSQNINNNKTRHGTDAYAIHREGEDFPTFKKWSPEGVANSKSPSIVIFGDKNNDPFNGKKPEGRSPETIDIVTYHPMEHGEYWRKKGDDKNKESYNFIDFKNNKYQSY